jgi:hypothetical protein
MASGIEGVTDRAPDVRSRLRCGGRLLFAGVHDLMHAEVPERPEASPARGAGRVRP